MTKYMSLSPQKTDFKKNKNQTFAGCIKQLTKNWKPFVVLCDRGGLCIIVFLLSSDETHVTGL